MLLDTLFHYISSECVSVIQSSEEIQMTDNNKQHYVYDFFLRSIWSPIVDFFFRRIGTIFVPSDVDSHIIDLWIAFDFPKELFVM